MVFLVRAPEINMGVDYQINLFSESWHAGFVDIRTELPFEDVVTGTVPIVFTDTSFTVAVPLAMLGGDNGLVNYSVVVGVVDIAMTDRLPNDTVPATSVPAAELIAIDDCAGLTISRSGVPSNNLFPVGETIVTYTATDRSGNAVSATQTVTVVDNTPPVISEVAVSPSTLWPPNHDMVDATVSYNVSDNCAVLDTSISVGSNEPTRAVAGSDWEIVDAHHVRLRAARLARWGDRLYTITITARDIHDNTSRRHVTVRVPHYNDKGTQRREMGMP